MNITRQDLDALNTVIKIDIVKADYSDKVTKILGDYRKTANIPGFRKGHVPMQMVKKQYGKAVLVDEVNKLIQEALGNYLVEEKLDVLGNPLPKPQEDLNWDNDDFSFEFELGLAPQFEVNLKAKKAITHYKIIADDKMIASQIENIQKQYGKLISQTEISKTDEITGSFLDEEQDINITTTFTLDKIKSKSDVKKFIGLKVGDAIALQPNNLFTEEREAINLLKITSDQLASLNTEIQFKISEINTRQLADLDQDLFDKLFADGSVKSVTDLKAKIKEDAEKQFVQQSDQKLLNDITEHLITNTTFDLPAAFLQKWMQTAGDNPLDEAQAKEEYEKSEKAMRYQLIEGRIITDNKLEVTFEDVKTYSKAMIKTQMAQFGQLNPSEKELDDISDRVLSNQDETKRLSEQVISQKLLEFYKQNVNLKEKELSYDKFIKEAYKS